MVTMLSNKNTCGHSTPARNAQSPLGNERDSPGKKKRISIAKPAALEPPTGTR